MRPMNCEFEREVVAAVLESRWPDHADAELRAHVACCAVCREVVAVASALGGSREELVSSATLPDAGRVWLAARLRVRREAVEAAGRPITAAQVIAFACAMGLLGACFGATSTWFQSVLQWAGPAIASVDFAAWLGVATAVIAEHGALAIAMAAIILVIPTAVFVVLGRD